MAKKTPKIKEEIIEMMKLTKSDEFVSLDIETIGFSPAKGGRLIEVGAVKIKNGKIIDRFEQLIDPECKIPTDTTEITGISNEMVKGKPVIEQVLPKFAKFIGNAVVVGHNVNFDWDRFLLVFFKKVGIIPKNKKIDTQALSKQFFPNNKDEKKKHGLSDMCNRLSVILDSHHRALADAEATGECLLKMIVQFKTEIETISAMQVVKLDMDIMSGKQQGFDIDIPVVTKPTVANSVEIHERDTNESKLNVRKVAYWEKAITKAKFMRRHYISINDGSFYGTVYFDIPKKTWYNKDFPGNLDFEKVQILVLKFLNIKTVEELCSFKN